MRIHYCIHLILNRRKANAFGHTQDITFAASLDQVNLIKIECVQLPLVNLMYKRPCHVLMIVSQKEICSCVLGMDRSWLVPKESVSKLEAANKSRRKTCRNSSVDYSLKTGQGARLLARVVILISIVLFFFGNTVKITSGTTVIEMRRITRQK